MKKFLTFIIVLLFAFVLVGCGEKVTISVNVTDDSGDDLDVTIYHALDGEKFKDAVKMTKGAGGVYSTVWEAFGISDEDNSRFKIVVSDGDKETEIYTKNDTNKDELSDIAENLFDSNWENGD